MSKQQEIKAMEVLGKIMHVEENTWLLPSLSDPAKYHTVSRNGENYECDCTGFGFTQNCYHLVAVKMVNKLQS
jgi:hypothetical protein